jgi:catechol 2,3-dioxygenase-like lactoylglutathione lyase family enzyme
MRPTHARRDDGGVKITYQVVVFDAADLAAESRFWAGVFGGTVDAEDDWHMVLVDGQPRIGVQLAPNHVPPDWPDGTPQQIHLDLWVDDPAAAHDLVMSLGATVLKEAEDEDSPDTFQVYADPAGHPFCLCWVKPRQY